MKILKILIADDEHIILEGLRSLYDWESNGYEIVAVATDGLNTVNLALKTKPHIILLDINMPLLNGFEVLEKLTSELPNTKFIIISGYDDYKLLRMALKFHAFDYLLKPLHPEDLAATLQNAREEIFSQKISKVQPHKNKQDTPLFEQMTEYIDDHLSEKISLTLLSEHFNLNPDYISSYFKKKNGMNFSDYLNSRRIAKAKTLLQTTDLNIGCISERVGFSDYRYFNKVFQNYLHVTPSQYRLEYHERKSAAKNI